MKERRWILPAAILMLAVLGPWLVSRSPLEQEDPAGGRHLPPWSRAQALRTHDRRVRIVTGLRRVGDAWEFRRAGRTGSIEAADLTAPPEARLYVLGTDGLGRDLAARLLHGMRHSVAVAVSAVGLSLLLGVGAGALAGYRGGWTDALVMRVVDVFLAVPRLLVYLVLAALLRPSTPLLILAIGATTWTGLARIVRAEVAALRGSDFVAAARAVGAPLGRLVRRHLLPQVAAVVAVSASLRFADTLLLESALSFLGLGSPPPAVSLGTILASAREAPAGAWWVTVFPGVALVVLVLLARAVGRSLFSASDPPSIA